MASLHDELEALPARVDRVIWLNGTVINGIPGEDLCDYLDYCKESGTGRFGHQIVAKLPTLTNLNPADLEGDGEKIFSAFEKADGFLVLISTPVPVNVKAGMSYMISWENIATVWAHVNDMSEVPAIARDLRRLAYRRAMASAGVGGIDPQAVRH